MRRSVVVVVAGLALAGCGGGESSNGGPSFDEAVDSGAQCDELIDIRNQEDPKAPIIETMNETLRSIGCFSTSSERTDQ